MSKNTKKPKNPKGKNKKNDPFPELGAGGAGSNSEIPSQWGNSPLAFNRQSGSIQDGISRMNIQDTQNPWNTGSAPKKPAVSSGTFTESSTSAVATQPNTSNKNLGAKAKAPKSAMSSAPSTSKAEGAIPKVPVAFSKAPSTVQGASITVPSHGRAQSTRTDHRLKKQLKPFINDSVRSKPDNVLSKAGTSGTRTMLTANYFRLMTKNQFLLYQYVVDFSPEVVITSFRKQLLEDHKKQIGHYLYDGTSLFLKQRLERDTYELVSLMNHNSERVKVTIRFTNIVDSDSLPAIQVLNIIYRKAIVSQNLQLVGRNFYDAKNKIINNQFGLQLWPGMSTSIRQHEKELLLCVEPIFKVMRNDTVYDVFMNCMRNNHPQDARRAFSKAIIGQTVLTDYNNRTYRIDNVDYGKTPQSKFPHKNGEEISFVEYYKNRYAINIRDVNQPILVSYCKAPYQDKTEGISELALIPEVCRTTGITPEMEKNQDLMKELSNIMRLTPRERQHRLIDYNQKICRSNESMQVLRDWGMTLEKQLIQVPARVLNFNRLIMGQNKTHVVDWKADWSRQLGESKLLETAKLDNWCYILPKRSDERTSLHFIEALRQRANHLGIVMSRPRIEYIHNDSPDSYCNAIDVCINKYSPQLLMLVLLNRNKIMEYSAIKRKTFVDRSVLSQCVVENTIRDKGGPRFNSIASKIATQINCKLGCIPWNIEMPPNITILNIGFDVNHDTKNRKHSYGATVASLHTGSKMKFFSSVSRHDKGEELSNHMGTDAMKALRAFYTHNQTLPDVILFYRDGVGEGQLPDVLSLEVIAVEKQLTKLYTEHKKKLRLAYIVVNKRLNTRLFIGDNNPQPGTVVDSVITLPQKYDFFLISQKVNQGTVSPTSYNIIYDSTGFTPDLLHVLTFKNCHVYYNWAGTTRIPAVCQYAHKLAFLVGQYIHSCPNDNLNQKLYFL